MKKLLITLTLILSAPLAAMAVEATAASAPIVAAPIAPSSAAATTQPKMCKKVERMTKELGLNAEQQTKVNAIFEQQKEKRKALREEMHKQLEAVLTLEQMAKMQAKHNSKKGKHGKGDLHGVSDDE